MKMELKPGDRLEVSFFETDGLFVITYGEADLTIFSELPGNRVGGEGVIYHEHYGLTAEQEAERAALLPRFSDRLKRVVNEDDDDEGSD